MKITKVKLQLNTPHGPLKGTPAYLFNAPVNLKLTKSRKEPHKFTIETIFTVKIDSDTFAECGDVVYYHPNLVKRAARALVGISGTANQIALCFRVVGDIQSDGQCRLDFALIDLVSTIEDDEIAGLLARLIKTPHVIDIEYSK